MHTHCHTFNNKKLVSEFILVMKKLKGEERIFYACPEKFSIINDCCIECNYNRIEGVFLSEILEKDEKISITKSVKYTLQIAKALQFLHSKRILHLDIKPTNILIDTNDNAILIDFDNARFFENGETKVLKGHSNPYAPEEIWTDKSVYIPQTDIYMLAAVFYEMLSGSKPPYATHISKTTLILNNCPQTIQSLVCVCLSGNISDRNITVEDIIETLEKWHKEVLLSHFSSRAVDTERS